MSGVMNPFDTLFGVVMSRRSSRRTLMLPSLLATYAREYSRRPTSTMSARTCSSARDVLIPAFLRAEVARRSALLERQGRARRHKRAAHRVAPQLDVRQRTALLPCRALDDVVHDAPEHPGDDEQEDQE